MDYRTAIFEALQYVLACFLGIITPSLIIGGVPLFTQHVLTY